MSPGLVGDRKSKNHSDRSVRMILDRGDSRDQRPTTGERKCHRVSWVGSGVFPPPRRIVEQDQKMMEDTPSALRPDRPLTMFVLTCGRPSKPARRGGRLRTCNKRGDDTPPHSAMPPH